MKEIKEYDVAAKKFYDSQQCKSLPLESWDIFATQFGILSERLKELTTLKHMAATKKWYDTTFFEDKILDKNLIVLVTDTQLNIVHASKNIFYMNGYRPSEIIGKKPKIFQGKKTCKTTAFKLREAVVAQEPFEATILNYRKNGSLYNCWIKGVPIKDTKGKVVNFIAFEREIA